MIEPNFKALLRRFANDSAEIIGRNGQAAPETAELDELFASVSKLRFGPLESSDDSAVGL